MAALVSIRDRVDFLTGSDCRHDIEQFVAMQSLCLGFALTVWNTAPSPIHLALASGGLRWPLVVALLGVGLMGTSCAKLGIEALCKVTLGLAFLVWGWIGFFVANHIALTAPTVLYALVACGFSARGYRRLDWTWRR